MRKAGKILSLLCFAAAAVLAVLAIADKAPYWAAARDSEELIAQYTQPVTQENEKEEAAKPAASSSVPETPAAASPEQPVSEEVPKEELPADKTLLREIDWDGLAALNPDIVGWLYIPGTHVDYPILIGESDTEYLYKSSKGAANKLGSIFAYADTSRSLEDAHTVLYGHNMASGQMFGDLSEYQSRSYRNRYPYVYIYTPHRALQCTVYASYTCKMTDSVYTVGFSRGSDDFKGWVQETVSHRDYDCGIAPTGSEQVFTLSTCTDVGVISDRYVVHCVVTAEYAA